MTNGMSQRWTRGESVVTGHKGKHGGPSIQTNVVKVLVPKSR